METLLAVVIRNRFVVLDTETTGLGPDAQVCQIAVIDQDGQVLLDTLVKPTIPIPADATAIHGITNDMVAGAPGMADVIGKLADAIQGKDLIIYNASYDIGVIGESVHVLENDEALSHWSKCLTPPGTLVCAMEAYAEYWGDWNEYHQSFTWQRLTTACR